MTRDEHVTSLAARLGSRTDLTTEIITKMKSVQQFQLEGGAFLPWFLQEKTTLTLALGAATVAIPTGFLRPVEDAKVRIYPTTDATDLDELVLTFADAFAPDSFDEDAKPTQVSLLGETFYFDRNADVEYKVYLPTYMRDAVLDTNIENDWLKYAGDWMEGEVLLKMGVRLQSPGIVKEAKEEIQLAKDRLWRMHEARRNAGEES